jgi:hypothetical protein
MAAVTSAVIAGGAALYGANRQAAAGRDGAAATERGNNAAISEQRRQYDLTRGDNQPWLDAGRNALTLQNNFLAGDRSGFENSTDYKWALDQGFKGLDRGAAAGGGLYSGGADADRIALGQGLASQYEGDYYNRLAGMSGTGQTTASQLGQFGANSANQIGGYLQNSGNARASAYNNSGNAWANAGNQLAGIGSWYASQRGKSGSPAMYNAGVKNGGNIKG